MQDSMSVISSVEVEAEAILSRKRLFSKRVTAPKGVMLSFAYH